MNEATTKPVKVMIEVEVPEESWSDFKELWESSITQDLISYGSITKAMATFPARKRRRTEEIARW